MAILLWKMTRRNYSGHLLTIYKALYDHIIFVIPNASVLKADFQITLWG